MFKYSQGPHDEQPTVGLYARLVQWSGRVLSFAAMCVRNQAMQQHSILSRVEGDGFFLPCLGRAPPCRWVGLRNNIAPVASPTHCGPNLRASIIEGRYQGSGSMMSSSSPLACH